MATPESEAYVRTFVRGLKVIEVLGLPPGRHTIGQLAAETGLPRTAIRRFLSTLMDIGMVESGGKLFWLTPGVLKLGLSFLSTLPYWREAQLALEELCAHIQQSCALSVLDGNEIVYLQRQHAKRILPMSPSLGTRMPAYAVSMGRVLLAGLPDDRLEAVLGNAHRVAYTPSTITDTKRLMEIIASVREKGYAWGDRELDESICGLAVPVRDINGAVVAAINVSLPAGRFTEASAIEAFLTELRLTAARLRESMQQY